MSSFPEDSSMLKPFTPGEKPVSRRERNKGAKGEVNWQPSKRWGPLGNLSTTGHRVETQTLIHTNTCVSYLLTGHPPATDDTDVQIANIQTCRPWGNYTQSHAHTYGNAYPPPSMRPRWRSLTSQDPARGSVNQGPDSLGFTVWLALPQV